MRVRKLDTTRARDVRQFIVFPFQLYRDCRQWVPPLLPDMRLALNRARYPFYRSSEADFYVVESEGQTLGRIAVLENRPYNAFHGIKTAFFYYFEVVEDAQAAGRLFDAAFEWARKRGLEVILGPKGLLRGDGNGLLVEGFAHRPAVGIAYNFPYYDAFVRQVGFDKEIDYFSGHLSREYQLPQRICDIAEKVKERRGFWVRSCRSKKEFLALAPAIQAIYNRAFVQVWGYYPLSVPEVTALIRRISAIAEPRLIKLVMRGDEPIGFILAYPDISAAIRRIRGRLWPLGWVHLLREARRTEWVNFNGVGILPEYQGVGANTVLYVELFKTIMEFDYQHGDFVQVAESNLQSLGDANAAQVQWYKRHRIYRRGL